MKKQVQITIDEDLLKEVQTEAESAGGSLSNYIVWILRQRMAQDVKD